MDARLMSKTSKILALAIVLMVAGANRGFAQSDFSEAHHPTVGPGSTSTSSDTCDAPRTADPEAADTTGADECPACRQASAGQHDS